MKKGGPRHMRDKAILLGIVGLGYVAFLIALWIKFM